MCNPTSHLKVVSKEILVLKMIQHNVGCNRAWQEWAHQLFPHITVNDAGCHPPSPHMTFSFIAEQHTGVTTKTAWNRHSPFLSVDRTLPPLQSRGQNWHMCRGCHLRKLLVLWSSSKSKMAQYCPYVLYRIKLGDIGTVTPLWLTGLKAPNN